jgi:cell fate regulator YaaT (PSP1 superfamily)
MLRAIIVLDLVFLCTSSRPCKRTACIVHGEQCYYLTAKKRSAVET